jgi:hypothetical protein
MTELTEAEKHKAFAYYVETMELAADYRRTHLREFAPEWYPWQHKCFETKSLQIMVLAANQCLGSATPIETVDGVRPLSELIGAKSFGVQSWDGESRCVSQASPVFLKCIEPMFRFHLDNGLFFDCTRKHRVLTKFGWMHADQLMWLVSGQRWSQTHEDWMSSCVGDGSQYGQPPQGLSDTDPIQPPSQGDAQAPNPSALWQKDAAAQESQYNQTWQLPSRQAISDDPSLLSALCEQFESRIPHTGDKRYLLIHSTSGRRRAVVSVAVGRRSCLGSLRG